MNKFSKQCTSNHLFVLIDSFKSQTKLFIHALLIYLRHLIQYGEKRYITFETRN